MANHVLTFLMAWLLMNVAWLVFLVVNNAGNSVLLAEARGTVAVVAVFVWIAILWRFAAPSEEGQ